MLCACPFLSSLSVPRHTLCTRVRTGVTVTLPPEQWGQFGNVLALQVKSNRYMGRSGRDRDLLRAGRSGDRIPVHGRFSAAVKTGPGGHPTTCTMGTGSLS